MAKTTKRRTVKRATKKTAVVVDNGPAPITPDHAGRNVGCFAPYMMRVVAGQNQTFIDNVDMELTDGQLAMLWSAIWPMSDVGRNGYTPRHVAGARRDFNRGRHGNPVPPDSPVPQFTVDPNNPTKRIATVRAPRTA